MQLVQSRLRLHYGGRRIGVIQRLDNPISTSRLLVLRGKFRYHCLLLVGHAPFRHHEQFVAQEQLLFPAGLFLLIMHRIQGFE